MLSPAASLPSHSFSGGPNPAPVVLRGVTKTYRPGGVETPVLHGVDLEINRGECVFLLGPSGSGKTTLLSIIGCLLTPDCGAVNVLGYNLASLSPRELTVLRQERLGFVFQRFHLIRGLNALENASLPLTLAGHSPADTEERAAELLYEVGLADKLRTDCRRLSVGQCQRVALARALAADPDLILADEPTAALDGDSGHQAMELLRRLTVERGKTAVIVTHDHRIVGFADRVVRLERGLLVDNAAAADGGNAKESAGRAATDLTGIAGSGLPWTALPCPVVSWESGVTVP